MIGDFDEASAAEVPQFAFLLGDVLLERDDPDVRQRSVPARAAGRRPPVGGRSVGAHPSRCARTPWALELRRSPTEEPKDPFDT